jgi:hypothetical protein
MESFENFEWLNKLAPCFEVDSKDIEVLDSPNEFLVVLKVRRLRRLIRAVLENGSWLPPYGLACIDYASHWF